MVAPSSFDYGAEDWYEFKAWLKEQHIAGNNLLGLGIDDIGFVAFNYNHTVREADMPNHLQLPNSMVRILQDPDDDPQCYIALTDQCNSNLIQMQISWSRYHFLPIEESDYCGCEECKNLISNGDINTYQFQSQYGSMTNLPSMCRTCKEKHRE